MPIYEKKYFVIVESIVEIKTFIPVDENTALPCFFAGTAFATESLILRP